MCRYKRLWIFGLFLFNIFLTTTTYGSRWSKTRDITEERIGHMGTVLTDGKIMILGGYHNRDMDDFAMFNPATGTWTSGSLPAGTHHDMGILLPNGKVLLIVGAGNRPGQSWLYNLFTSSWSGGPTFGDWYLRGCATLLKDGRVLIVGFDFLDSTRCVLYDYTTNSITETDSTKEVHLFGAIEVLLPSGEVLVAGRGVGGMAIHSDKCEIYSPSSNTWTPVGRMSVERGAFVGILLPPPWNEVLVAGTQWNHVYETELYNPISKTWSPAGNLNSKIRAVPGMVLLPSGKVLLIGGENHPGFVNWTKDCEIYDPDFKRWDLTDFTDFPRSHFISAILQTGKVFITGSGYWPDFTATSEIYDPSDGNWATKSYTLNTERATHTVTPLPIIHIPGVCSTNVLISGGENSTGALASCEVYNYNLDQGAFTDDLAEARSHHTAMLLVSGQVLVAGGKDGATIRSSSELYDVSTQLWSSTTGPMTDARYDHTATLLANGDVLVTGGENGGGYLPSCEIYNSGTWTPTPVMATPRARHTAIILLDENILVIGGQTTGGAATATCELWNGATWTNSPSMSTARYWHTATLLQSGKVLVAGGTSNSTSGLSSCEIFDPDSNKWFPEGSLNTARYLHNTTLLYSGLVLVTGGNSSSNSCEIWDPAAEWDEATNTHQWKVTTPLTNGRAYHSSVLLPIDKPYIFAIGGKSGSSYLNSIERYDVGLGYRSIWQSEITNYPTVTHISDSMDIEGTDFRGFSEADGGNGGHIVSNDHPIISLVRIGGGNWQGNGGGEILHMPLSSSWNDTHTIVNPEVANFQGYYRLWSIVNGIPCKWYNSCVNIEEKTDNRRKATNISVAVYPNPATTKASIKFRVQSPEIKDKKLSTLNSQLLTLKIYDLSGRLVRSLPIMDYRSPITEITWDRKDSNGEKVKSGIYFYRLNCKDFEIKGKFVILK